jgi:hypothetical protein
MNRGIFCNNTRANKEPTEGMQRKVAFTNVKKPVKIVFKNYK